LQFGSSRRPVGRPFSAQAKREGGVLNVMKAWKSLTGALCLGLVAGTSHAERVSGHVHSDAGAVKAHVRVVVPLEGARRCENTPALFRAALQRRPKVLAEVDTNSRGEFDLEYAPEGQPRLEVFAPGYDAVDYSADQFSGPGKSPQRRGIGLNRAAPLAPMRVLSPARKPVPGARVTYSAEGEAAPVTVETAANGSARVGRAGCYLVEASGYASKVVWATGDVYLPLAPRVVVRLTHDGAPADANLAVEQNGPAPSRDEVATDGGVAVIDSTQVPFTVRVKSDAGFAIAQVSTQATREVSLELRPSAHLRVTTPLEKMEWLSVELDDVTLPLRPLSDDPDEGVELDVSEGTHLLKVSGTAQNGRAPKHDVAEWVEVRGSRTVRLDLRRQVLTGQVVSASGALVSGAAVHVDSDLTLKCGMGMGMCTPVQRFTAKAVTVDGGFALSLLEPGEYRVTAYSPGLGMARARVQVPAPPQRLVLAPGAPLEVRADGGGIALFDPDAAASPAAEPLLEAQAVNGVARFENLRGCFRAVSADREGVVEVGDAGVVLELTKPLARSEVTGAVVDEHERPVDLMVCATLRGQGACAQATDGGFSVRLEVAGAPHRIAVNEDGWAAKPVWAKAGETVTLHARRWKPTEVTVTDAEGRAVPGLIASDATVKGRRVTFRTSHRADLFAPGFAPQFVELEPPPTAVQLARLPLTGTVSQADGTAAEGAMVAFLCEGVLDDPALRWARYVSDIGPTSWTYWPGGVECIAGFASVDARGRFTLSRLARPAVAVEVRHGQKVLKVPWKVGEPLVLTLP
jgi:hypothetical protein